MKERTDPVTAEDGTESHPAFGMISVSRVTATPGEVLFQSDVRHNQYMVVRVHEATRQRSLKRDWLFARRRLVEVSMSMAQFAAFVASVGTEGVPCNIDWTESGERPGITYSSRLALTSGEVRDSAERAYEQIQEAFLAYREALTVQGAGSAAAKKSALRTLEMAIVNAAKNVAWASKVLDEHAEDVVAKTRADIEAMVASAAQRLGVPLSELRASESGSPAELTGYEKRAQEMD